MELCAALPVVSTPAGGVLIEEGTRPNRLLVLVEGEVTIERDGTALARVDAPGAVFGEMSAVLGQPATATVRASSDVRVHVVEDPPLARALYASIDVDEVIPREHYQAVAQIIGFVMGAGARNAARRPAAAALRP